MVRSYPVVIVIIIIIITNPGGRYRFTPVPGSNFLDILENSKMYHPAKFFGIAFAILNIFTTTLGVTSSPGVMAPASKTLFHRQHISEVLFID